MNRAKKLARGQDPGEEREPEFHWMIREELLAMCKNWADPGRPLVIFNLGANIGISTLKMNHILKTNLASGDYFIWAIEPDPNNFKTLQKNLSHNRAKAQAVECAIGAHDGEAKFNIESQGNLSSLARSESDDADSCSVKIYTLPSFAAAFRTGSPNFLKIDVEGAEVEVFRGGREFLAGCPNPCKLILEVHPMSYSGERSLEKEMIYLFEHGWTAKYMASAAVACPDKFKQAGLKPFKEFTSSHHTRAIYKDFSKERVLEFACHPHEQEVPGKKPSHKIVRSVFLEKA
jgi:FkbM family methyltransferase